jgi:hypothetical protein
VKLAPARSSRADLVLSKLLPVLHSIPLHLCLPPTFSSDCSKVYLPPSYTFLTSQLLLIFPLPTSQFSHLSVEWFSLLIYFSLPLFSTLLILHFSPFPSCFLHFSYNLLTFSTSHTTSRLPPLTPSTINTSNHRELPLLTLPTRQLKIDYFHHLVSHHRHHTCTSHTYFTSLPADFYTPFESVHSCFTAPVEQQSHPGNNFLDSLSISTSFSDSSTFLSSRDDFFLPFPFLIDTYLRTVCSLSSGSVHLPQPFSVVHSVY